MGGTQSCQIEFASDELYYAACQDDVQYARVILARFPDVATKNAIINGRFILHAAVEKGSVAFIQFLIEQGVELNTLNHSLLPQSALNLAVCYRRSDIALMLIEAGADVSIDPQHQMLINALNNNLEVVVMALLAKGLPIYSDDCLYVASRKHLLEVMVALRLACDDRFFDEALRIKLVNHQHHSARFCELLVMPLAELKQTLEAKGLLDEYPTLTRPSTSPLGKYGFFPEDVKEDQEYFKPSIAVPMG